MKKFIINLLLFTLFFGLFYFFSLYLWVTYLPAYSPAVKYPLGGYGHLHSRLKEAKTTTSVDILFLGSSHAYRGFDTRIFTQKGYSSFNLGSSAQTPMQTQVLLMRYLKQLQPKLIVYEVYPPMFKNEGTEAALDLIANEKLDFNIFKMAYELHNTTVYNSLLYSLGNQWLGDYNTFSEAPEKGNDTYISGGYVERKMAYYHPKPIAQQKIDLNKSNLAYFKENIKLIKEKNIPLVLLYTPITRQEYTTYQNQAYFDALMQQYAPYYNYNTKIPLSDKEHFYDTNHLNQKGVQRFNEHFIEHLLPKTP